MTISFWNRYHIYTFFFTDIKQYVSKPATKLHLTCNVQSI